VTLLDGREIALSGTREVGHGNRGIYVDDRRYGRVLISWDAFERADFSPGGSGPAYGDFRRGARSRAASPPAPATASPVGWSTTSTMSETIETLDAPIPGRGLHHSLRTDRVDRAPRPRRARRPARQGDPP